MGAMTNGRIVNIGEHSICRTFRIKGNVPLYEEYGQGISAYSLLCIGMRANNPQMELDLLPFALSVLAYLVLFALLSLRYLKKRDIAAE